jgi:hypothetical protein
VLKVRSLIYVITVLPGKRNSVAQQDGPGLIKSLSVTYPEGPRLCKNLSVAHPEGPGYVGPLLLFIQKGLA